MQYTHTSFSSNPLVYPHILLTIQQSPIRLFSFIYVSGSSAVVDFSLSQPAPSPHGRGFFQTLSEHSFRGIFASTSICALFG